MTEFSMALQGVVKFGLKQGLAKGLVVGSNSITFAIWTFMAYYGSRMVMYHGAKGGTVYAAGTSITFGGVALRSALSNLKDFSKALARGSPLWFPLLLRFYDPLGGEILLDGAPINTLQIKWLRSQMGLVSQKPTLFATYIEENIRFGKEDATIQEVMEAARASNAHDFISQ
ncbi:hypothetical protein CRG98_045151 [Punica granatum]|uniref:ABC transporter domain-containing protein n=1 Tax=Punica granatum TaxID=22663 RepID=A0A2I0HRV8_PUNGR|nr:hypothetical protein CRG98_045151 [Punica granatum]